MNGESYLTRRRGPIRPRESGIRFSIHEATKIDGFIVRPGAVIQPAIGDRPIALGSPSVEISYDRSKGRKVLLRAPVDPAAPSIHPDAHFLNYDSVFGIDTNTLSIGGDVVSVSCLYQCEFARTDEGVSVKLIPEIAVEFRGLIGDPERRGWRYFCEAAQEAPGYSPNLNLGIVVDSSLDALAAMNQRTVPVINDWYLPERMTLIYASDAAADSIANQLIRACDDDATKVLRMVMSGSAGGPLCRAAPGAPYTHFRVWRWTPP